MITFMEMSNLMSSSCFTSLLFFAHFIHLSDSSSISDGIFGSQFSSERRLLQAKKSCTINFEFQNYTIITSRCKGPRYLPTLCCPAFKDFACPFVDDLNDLSNDCATTMFSYINLYGKYPPGLFSLVCREGKQGLECPPLPPSSSQSEKSNAESGIITWGFLPLLISLLTAAMFVLQFIDYV